MYTAYRGKEPIYLINSQHLILNTIILREPAGAAGSIIVDLLAN